MSAPKTKTKYVSKGERRAIAKDVCKSVKRDRTAVDYWTTKQKAWLAGKNPWITVDNPNTAETNKRKIRVRAESARINGGWGDPREFVNILGRA